MKRRPANFLLAFTVCSALLGAFACSGSDGPGSLFGPGSSKALVGDLSGTWEGEAGNTQAPAILVIRQDGNRLEGTLTWPGNDVRTFTGEVGDPFVELHFPSGEWDNPHIPDYSCDEWFLSAREDSLDGIALENHYGFLNNYNTFDVRLRRVK